MPQNKVDSPLSSFVEDTIRATQRLADQRASVSAQAERLNTCIERFEAWIACLPGRVETRVGFPIPSDWRDHPDADLHEFSVRVSRSGKDWRVSWAYYDVRDELRIDWKPLREASLDAKLHVVPQLPRLIVEMANQQEQLKSRIDAVASSFEEFASQVGMPKEGK